MTGGARAPVIAGNWKMNHGPDRARAFFEALGTLPDAGPEVLIFPPAVSLLAASACPERDPRVRLGVQNIHHADSGAFTGEVSAGMAAEAGATHALVGHSERRHVFGETDREVALKVAAALRGGLVPVVCVGETLEERRAGRLEEVILRQLDAALEGLGTTSVGALEFLLAYEPVWAIGTGETATPDDASSAHRVLRGRLAERLGSAGDAVPILYGGSVNPANAGALLTAEAVGGLLVGGASLEAESFRGIVRAGL